MSKQENSKKYRILEVCVDLDGGGIDRYLYNYCTRIDDIQFDFAAVESKQGILEVPLKEHGCQIYHIPRLSVGVIKNYKALKKIMKAHQYDAVHVHLGVYSWIALLCAKMSGIKTRIVHAHIANVPESRKDKLIRKTFTPITKMFATDLAACGIDAAKWVWGVKDYESGKVVVHNNAIDTSIYEYNSETRKDVRGVLGVSDQTLVVGHVGRVSDQKNQLRLVNIFKSILDLRPDAILLAIGYIDKSYGLEAEIHRLGIENSVRLLGVRDDVPKLLNAMDVFVFPSKYEGLPFTLIETQCNGLPSLSSNAVTPYAKVSEYLEFLPLSDSDCYWSKKAVEMSQIQRNAVARKDVIRGGYDLDTEAIKLKKYYIDRINNG